LAPVLFAFFIATLFQPGEEGGREEGGRGGSTIL